MNHPHTPLALKNEVVKDDSAHVDIDIQQIRTATTEGSKTGASPNSKSSEESLVVDDAAYLAPDKYDVLLQDITAKYLVHDLSSRFQVEYLSHLGEDEERERYKSPNIHGSIVGNNKRFLMNLPCRRMSNRNLPSSPKNPLPFVNIFFLVDTGSPFSFVCPDAMEMLCGGKGNPIPSCVEVELLTGNPLELYVSPSDSHFSNINLLGGSALSIADLVSQNRQNSFFLHFNGI